MMGNETQRITIEGTNDEDVAYALANLSGFSKGCFIRRTNNIYHRELSEKCVVAFHQESMKEAGHEHPMLYPGPDFVVTRVYRFPREGEHDWQPTDEYLIDYGPKYVTSDLIDKIGEEIGLAYSEIGR